MIGFPDSGLLDPRLLDSGIAGFWDSEISLSVKPPILRTMSFPPPFLPSSPSRPLFLLRSIHRSICRSLFPLATQGFRCKSVYREHKTQHYRQISAATQTFRLERVCREQGGFKRVCRMETVCRVRYRWASGRLQAGSMRQASQQEPPCGISQRDKGCGRGGGRSRQP